MRMFDQNLAFENILITELDISCSLSHMSKYGDRTFASQQLFCEAQLSCASQIVQNEANYKGCSYSKSH